VAQGVMLWAAACLTASVVPTARGMLSMGVYRALPEPFARVDRRTGAPIVSTIAVGVASAAVLIFLSIISNHVLGDSTSAIMLLIAFYYTLLGLGCLWYFRHELWRSGGDFLEMPPRSRNFFRGETFTPEWAEAHAPDLVEIV
jgi:amino acid transporter